MGDGGAVDGGAGDGGAGGGGATPGAARTWCGTFRARCGWMSWPGWGCDGAGVASTCGSTRTRPLCPVRHPDHRPDPEPPRLAGGAARRARHHVGRGDKQVWQRRKISGQNRLPVLPGLRWLHHDQHRGNQRNLPYVVFENAKHRRRLMLSPVGRYYVGNEPRRIDNAGGGNPAVLSLQD